VLSGVAKFIYFSTFQVYGNADDLSGLIAEETAPNPSNVYAQTKLAAEKYLNELSENGMQGIILRLSNAVGAPADFEVAQSVWDLAFNAFVIQGLKQGVIRPNSFASRDFIGMNSVLDVLDVVLKSDFDSNCETYNLGGGKTISIVELAQNISQVMKNVEVVVPRGSASSTFAYSINKIEQLGCNIKLNLASEIEQCVKVIKLSDK